MQAAILRARLPFLQDWTAARRQLRRRIAGARGRAAESRRFGCDNGHAHLFVARTSRRDAFQDHLRARGIETLVHYPVPIPHQRALAGERPAECPAANLACREVVSLPLYPGLTASAVSEVAAAVRDFHEV